MIEVDPSKLPVISGTDLWYPCRCAGCYREVGLLANVESPGMTEFITEEYHRCPKVQ